MANTTTPATLPAIGRALLLAAGMLAAATADAATDLYRLVWTSDPATTMTVGWRQLSGSFTEVRYRDRNDPFAPWTSETSVRTASLVNLATGPDTGDPSGVVPTQDPFETHFVDLTGLEPDTDYEFEICDTGGCSSPYMYFRTAPATPQPFTLIAGGDSRRTSSTLFGANDMARRRGFELVGKIRPLAVVFSGDFMDEGVYGEWLIWMDEWQLTRSSDGRMYPLVPSHGNHENQDRRMISKVFGTTDAGVSNGWGTFGELTIGGNLMRIFTLNSSLDPSTSAAFGGSIGYNDLRATDTAVVDAWNAQTTWLDGALAQADSDGVVWKVANYHHPLRPHETAKDDGVGRVTEWGPLFDQYDVDLAIESDTHNLKYTVPIVPDSNTADALAGATAEEDFVEADWAAGKHGTVFIGEGSWGAPKRAANDDKRWTLVSDSVWQFKLIRVSPDEIRINTVLFEEDSYPTGVAREVMELTQAAQDADPLAMPAGLDLWLPFEGDLPLTLTKGTSPGDPTFLAVTPKPVIPDTGGEDALFFEDFNDGTLGQMEAVDVSCSAQADDSWFNATNDSFGTDAARINTFPASGTCDDWLITPAIDLSTLDGVTLSFRSAAFFSGANLRVLASSDYVPGTDPTTATWQPMNPAGSFDYQLPPGTGSLDFAPSGPIAIEATLFPEVERDSVHIAIRHLKTSGSREWTVDDIRLDEGLVPVLPSVAGWRPVSVTSDRDWRVSDFGGQATMNINGYTLAAGAQDSRDYLVSPVYTVPADATDADFQFRYRYAGLPDPNGTASFEALILDNCTLTGTETPAQIDALGWTVLRSTVNGDFAGAPGVYNAAAGSDMTPYQGHDVCFAFRYVSEPVVAQRFGVAGASLGESVQELDVPVKRVDTVRFAMFNTLLANRGAGVMAGELATGGYTQAQGVAEIIQRVNPDVILLNEFDYDTLPTPPAEGPDDPNAGLALERFVRNYVEVSQNGQSPITDYAYLYSFPSNTGLQPEAVTGFDCNFSDPTEGCVAGDSSDPAFDDGNDAFGFGLYEGSFGMAILSRYPIDTANLKTFQKFLWKDMPSSLIPDRAIGTQPAWYSAEEADIYRLSSKNHVDVPIVVDVNGTPETIHVLGSHPTPPVFDDALESAAGPQYVGTDPHGRRNHDEIRFWADYVSKTGNECYIYDDSTADTTKTPSCLGKGRRFVIMGDQNADPQFGDSFASAILQLLNDPAIDDGFTPISSGATGTPPYATLDNGQWRLDYALPSVAGLDYAMAACDPGAPGYPGLACGVFYPSVTSPLAALIAGSCATPDPGDPPPNCASADHRLVWVDVTVGADTDGDAVVDDVDNCPAAANADQGDVDADQAGDPCDPDADGDGLPKTWETDNGLDDTNPLDALADTDGDGLNAIEEFEAGRDPNVSDNPSVEVPMPPLALAFGALVLGVLGLRRRPARLPQPRRAPTMSRPLSALVASFLVVSTALGTATDAVAEQLTATAFDAATVRPAGPRPAADNGKAFFNVEGLNNGVFANYGVLRFRLDTAAGDATSDLSGATIDAVTLRLTQANAGFTQTGNVAVWFSGDDDLGTGADDIIDDEGAAGIAYDSAFTFDPSAPFAITPARTPFANDFPNATIVGGEEFLETATGDLNEIALTRNLTVFAHTDGGGALVVTLILAEFNDEDMAATYEGLGGSNPPQLIIDYTPAP